MGAVRMNITLPTKIASQLKRKVKPRERSQIIAKALEAYFKKESKEALVNDLIEAYSTRAKEGIEDQELWDTTLNDGLEDETW